MIKRTNLFFVVISFLTIIIFFVYSNSNYLNFILGNKYVFKEINYTFTCRNLDFYCRNLSYEFYKYIFSFFTNNPNIIFFFQLSLFSFSSFYLVEQLNFKNFYFKFLSFLFIFGNPKVFKYCFSLTEESLFISFIGISLALFTKVIYNYSFKSLLFLSFFIGISFAIRPAGIFLFVLPLIIFIKYYSLIKLKLLIIIFLIFLPLQLDKIFFYKINGVHQPSFFWGTMLGKIPLFAKNINHQDDNYFEFQKILSQLNQKFKKDLEMINSHTLRQYHRNSTIELFKTSKIAGEIKIINDYFKSQEKHSNLIIKETFFSLLKENYLLFSKELFLNYLGIWELREVLNKKNHIEYFNLLKENKLNFSEKYNHILKSTNHPNFIVILSKIFMIIFFIINLYIFGIYFFYLIKKKDISAQFNLLFYLIVIINFYFLIISISTNIQTRLILTIWPFISFTIISFIINRFSKKYIIK